MNSRCDPEEAQKHVIILTCMDARIDPLQLFDFKLGQAYVLRNGGGRATDDMVRSAVLAIRFFAADSIYIVHHTDCGLEKVDDPTVRELLHQNLGPAHLDNHEIQKHNRDKYHSADYVAFLAFKDVEKSVINDVARLRESVLISREVNIFGYVLDIKSGKVKRVAQSP